MIASVTLVVLIVISIFTCIIYSIQYHQRKRLEEEQKREKSIKERIKIAQLLGGMQNPRSVSSDDENGALDAAEMKEMQKWKRKKLFLEAKKVQEGKSEISEQMNAYKVFKTAKKIEKSKSEYQKVKEKKKKNSQMGSMLKRWATKSGSYKIKNAKMLQAKSSAEALKSKSSFKLKHKLSRKLNKVSSLKQQKSKQLKSSRKVVTSLSSFKTKLMTNKSISKSKSKSRRQMSSKWRLAKSSKRNFSL